MINKADNEAQSWADSLNDPEKYIRCYLRAREIYLEYIEKDPSTIEWLTCDIERMIDIYLAQKGQNYILSNKDEDTNQEKVIDIAYILNQAVKSIERAKRRGEKS